MRLKLLSATAALVCVALSSMGAQAAPVVPASPFAQSSKSLAQPVDYRTFRNRCVQWREECRERWGFRSWRYRRCVSYHGCY